jgi:hypothetical protein
MFAQLTDWWRGWSDQDVQSALRKVQHNQQDRGEYIPLTSRELCALVESRIWHDQHLQEFGR